MNIAGKPVQSSFQVQDPISGAPVPIHVSGTVDLWIQPTDPRWAGHEAAMGDEIVQRIVGGMQAVIQSGLAQNQIAVPTLPQSIPYLLDRLMPQLAGEYAPRGANIQNLRLSIHLPHHGQGMAAPQGAQMAMQNVADAASSHFDPSNYEVRGKVNVGGFGIGFSSSGGVDTKGLENQAVEKVKSTLIWWAVAGVTLLFVLALLGWVAYASMNKLKDTGLVEDDRPEPSGKAKLVEWDGKAPYKCSDRGSFEIRDVKSKLDKGPVIDVSSSCKLTLKNVEIVTSGDAVKVLGKGEVVIEGGRIESKGTALSAVGAGTKITVKGAEIVGKKSAAGGTITGAD